MLSGMEDRQKAAIFGLAVVGLVAAGFMGGNYLRRPADIQMTQGLAANTLVSETTDSSVVVVQVDGAVTKPGVYKFGVNQRVNDALDRAGGTLRDADTTGLNLAEKLVDGSKIYVPRLGEDPVQVQEKSASQIQPLVGKGSKSKSGKSVNTATPGSISLNSASQAELESLPGIGPATAQKIIAYRGEHGGFKTIDELVAVKGIGPKKLEAMRKFLRL